MESESFAKIAYYISQIAYIFLLISFFVTTSRSEFLHKNLSNFVNNSSIFDFTTNEDTNYYNEYLKKNHIHLEKGLEVKDRN